MDCQDSISSDLQLAAKELLRELDSQGIRYCALHVQNGFLYELDIVVEPADDEKLKAALEANPERWLLKERHTGDKKVVLGYSAASGERRYATLRIKSKCSRAFISPAIYRSLLDSRLKVGGIWVTAEKVRLGYLLGELLSGEITHAGFLQLRELAGQIDKDHLQEITQTVCDLNETKRIANALRDNFSPPDHDRQSMHTRAQSRNPGYSLKQWTARLLHSLHGWLRPDRVFVIVLGPDGVGKSTTVEHLRRLLDPVFGRCVTHRWRPGAIRRVAPWTSQRLPHSRKPRGKFASPFYAVGVFLDFCVGYFVYLRAGLVRSEAIIFDRYFHDMLVDSRRYRYVGSKSLIRFLADRVPPASPLFVILDAEEEIILQRKQELPLEELTRQRKAYREFAKQVPHSLIVNTTGSVEETCNAVARHIFDYANAKLGSKQKQTVDATDICIADTTSLTRSPE